MELQKLPYKTLVKHSLRLLVFIVLAAGVVNSMYTTDLVKIILRLVLGFVFFGLIFFANIALLAFFDSRKKSATEKTGRKVFLAGWVLTFLLSVLVHSVIQFLMSKGFNIEVSQSEIEEFQKLTGWRKVIHLSFVSFFVNSFVFLIQNFVLHQIEKNRIENELLQLKAVNAETTNRLLQQQIQPHFLFNALNILKSLIKKYPSTAEAYLLRLSNFLRTSVTGNKSGIATVGEELKLCEDYMEMQKIRFGKALIYEVDLQAKKEYLTRKLPFFSIQPLLENAIKHNELTEESPLVIEIALTKDELVVKNNLKPKKTMEFSTGNGLSNLQERYRLLSGDELVIEQDETHFVVHLKLL